MIKNDRIINTLIYGDTVQKVSLRDGINESEARVVISKMSFSEYRELDEAVITPPSGQTIAPTSSSQQKPTAPIGTGGSSQIKSIWPGKGSAVEVGMTVGLKGPNGLPVPGQVSQVDMAAKGVKVKNPTTGQDEWANLDTLEPFNNTDNTSQINNKSGQGGFTLDQLSQMEESRELARLKHLSGISEECSGGATGAGSIAVAPAAIGKMKRRTDPVEESPSLEHPVAGRKTIVGATGPQASAIGKLSANNAARGKKTASRINNGIKR